jgi:hypothetical protein
MDSVSPVKDILYQELSDISENKIQIEISKNNSSKIISEIISKCYPKIQQISLNLDDGFGIFAESLMHYLLTIALVPSQRKISLKNIEIDIVIPDLRTLQSNPKDSLMIVFPKSRNKKLIEKRILDLEKIHTVKENIWIVLHEGLEFKNRTYLIKNGVNSLNKILDDINEFYSSRKQSKLKFIKS